MVKFRSGIKETIRIIWFDFTGWGSEGLFYVIDFFTMSIVSLLLEIVDCQVR